MKLVVYCVIHWQVDRHKRKQSRKKMQYLTHGGVAVVMADLLPQSVCLYVYVRLCVYVFRIWILYMCVYIQIHTIYCL